MSISPELRKGILEMAKEAVSYGKSFDKTLDYSRRSLADLEEILDYYYHDRLINHPTANQVHSMALIFGCYLGECILRNGGRRCAYDWADEPNEPILAHTSESRMKMAPVSKVEKRMMNGAVDNIVSFYDMALQFIWEGK